MAEESESGPTIGRFLVSDMLVIKQEPQEPIAESMDMDDCAVHAEADADADVNFADLTFTEVSDVVLQRAVSPPSYLPPDFDEEKVKQAMAYYTEKYNLKEAQIKLQKCDKIWKTLQLIKNLQNSSERQSSKSPDVLSYQPSLGIANKAVPDFRFSVKSKKKLYYCVTCGKEFIDSQHLRQHAVDEHGIFVNPKRIYTPRIDSHIDVATIPLKGDDELVEEQKSNISESTDSQHSENKQLSEQTENMNNEPNNDLKSNNYTIKTSNVKEKVKCILCKRISTDIVNHMKGYHKVGCINSIIAQCEKITTDIVDDSDYTNTKTNHEAASHIQGDKGTVKVLPVAVRKRKRSSTCWTIKKKYNLIDKNTQLLQKGPFKCNVCLGFYKTLKSFTYHKTLHQIRGETPKNFDPSKCRFLNSPLRNTARINHLEESVNNSMPDQREIAGIQTLTSNNCTATQMDDIKLNNESIISEDSNMEQTNCECGRSFRNYHTLYLHKVKCKGLHEQKIIDKSYLQSFNNDNDSGIGISIKIKKNKNDSYEVVPRNLPSEGVYKDSRNSKDSDASSNDSGMVSVDYNNQRPDSSELLSKYSKSHSILRIQVADDDEEVDIEDGEDSNKDNLNENFVINNDQNNVRNQLESGCVIESNGLKDCHTVPLLSNLCNQVLMKNEQTPKIFASGNYLIDHVSETKSNLKSNCPCGKNFKSFKYLNIHVRRYHPLLLKCSYCMTNFDRIEKYFEHKCDVIEGKLFIEPIIQTQCTECTALVDLGEQFDKHMRTHNLDSATFQCFKCDLKFDNQHQRKNHFNIEHGFSLCRICNKLLHIDYILKHEAYHDGLGYPCHVCKKAYDQKILLKEHIQHAHDPIVNEIVKCLVCSKKIKLRLLKKHLSLHLHSEICKKCNKCSQSNDQAKGENHKVTFEQSNDCTALNSTTCDVSFFSKQKLNNHRDKMCEFQENRI